MQDRPLPLSAKRSLFSRWQALPLYLRILAAVLLGLATGLVILDWKNDSGILEAIGVRDAGQWLTTLPGLRWLAPYGPDDWANKLAIPGQLVLRLLSALAPALILLAVVHALMHAEIHGRQGLRLIGLLLLNTLAAIMIGLLVANVVQPGRWSKEPPPPPQQHAAAQGGFEQFLENIPKSMLGPLGDNGKVMGVIFVAVAFGIALRKIKHEPIRNISDAVELGLRAMIVILHWIVEVVPLAVWAVVASTVGLRGLAYLASLGGFVIAVILALSLQMIYYLVRIKFGSWVRPWDALRGVRDALVMAFSTASSTATMPVTYQCLRENVGVRERSASLGALVGANFNNDGTALYEAMSALFIAQMLNMNLSLAQQFMVVVTSVIASVGAAGIPEAGLVTMTLVFNAVGLPTEKIPLLLAVDWFLDRCRTAVNVMGDVNVSCLLDGKTPEPVIVEPTAAVAE